MSEPAQIEDPTPEVTALLKEPALEQAIAGMSVDTRLKAEAYSLYLSTNQTPDEIGLSLSLPGFLVRHWIGTEKWAELRAKFLMQEFKKAELEYQQLLSEHRLSTAKRHLETAKRLEDEINFVLERLERAREKLQDSEPLPRNHDMSLVRLSQALKNATDISSRVVGITDRPPLSEGEAAKTIIMIGGKPAQSARFSETKNQKIIDVEVG